MLSIDTHRARPKLDDVRIRQVLSAVDPRQQRERVRFGALEHEHLEESVPRPGARRDHHAASVEEAVGHHYLMRASLEALSVGPNADYGPFEPRKRQPESDEIPGLSHESWEPGRARNDRCPEPYLGDVREESRLPPAVHPRVGHPANDDREGVRSLEVPAGTDGIAGKPERLNCPKLPSGYLDRRRPGVLGLEDREPEALEGGQVVLVGLVHGGILEVRHLDQGWANAPGR